MVKEVNGKKIKWWRQFIPAKVEDNILLMEQNPDYKAQLIASAAGKEHVLRAWLEGDWDIVAGGMFDDLWDRKVHVIRPFAVPASWKVIRAYDWGSSKPFSVGWWAISDGTTVMMDDGTTRNFPPNTLIRVKEWYGWAGTPNVGCRMLEKEIVEGIIEREKKWGLRVTAGPADTNIFENRNGVSLINEHENRGVYWKKAIKNPGSRVVGWQMIRQRLKASAENDVENPGIYVVESCEHFIRTFPIAMRDESNIEDIDVNTEDHILDETRYVALYKPARLVEIQIGGV